MAGCILVTGPPGAGKSTVAALVADQFETVALVPGDAFFAFWNRGSLSPWLPAAHEQNRVVLRAAAAAVGSFTAGGCDVVYDGVVGPWFLSDFTTAAGLSDLHYVVLLPTVEQCLSRVATRTGHGFSDPAATRRMHADFTRSQVEERHVLRELPEDPAGAAAEVLRRVADGRSLYRGPPTAESPPARSGQVGSREGRSSASTMR